MIVTLTPNTGIDHAVQVPGFRLNATIRATGSAWGMGGKASDVSWILGKLGVPTRALGFAAGSNGNRMEQMLRDRGVETDFVPVEGETRLNTVLVVPGQGHSTITTSSLHVLPAHLVAFADKYHQALDIATCVVMGGSLPQGVPLDFYAEVISQAHAKGIPVIFDSSGPALAAGMRAHPDLIKPNLAELGELAGNLPGSQMETLQAARKLHQEFSSDVIVTLGEVGAVAVLKSGSFMIHALPLSVLSAAGAGDGVLAGMALAYLRRESPEAGLRHGFALAGAILETLATADFQVEEYQRLLPLIRISPISP